MTGLLGSLAPSPVGLALKAAPYAAIVALSLVCWHLDSRAVANADTIKAQATQFTAAENAATQAWRIDLAQQTAQYQQEKTNAETAYKTQLASADAATAAYIRLHPAPASSGPVTPAKPTETAVAGLSTELPTGSVVLSADDVRSCSAVTTYALAARTWALSVGQ